MLQAQSTNAVTRCGCYVSFMKEVNQSSSGAHLRCRQIVPSDIDAVIELLKEGFGSQHSRRFWRRMFAALARYPTPSGMPKYGYLLEHVHRPVGVLLLISSMAPTQGGWAPRCNVSSWYVKPEFRSYAPLLVKRSISERAVTYINISPAPHTWSILEAQGYVRYADGLFVSVPMLSAAGPEETRIVPADSETNDFGDQYDRETLRLHAEFGCTSVWCVTEDGSHPFVFVPRMVWRALPCFQLVYCRSIAEFVRFARPLGRYLALRGRPTVIVDANGPVAGLVGRYFEDIRPKYFKGTNPPRLGDLAYTEASLFGI